MIETAEHYVRHEGIHRKAAEELSALLPEAESEAARTLREQLLGFVGEERAGSQGRTAVGVERSARINHRQVQSASPEREATTD